MISSAICSYKAQVNFSKTTKLNEPIGQVQFVVFEQFRSASRTKMPDEKTSQKVKTNKFLKVCVHCL